MNNPTTEEIIALVSNLFLPFHQITRQHRLPIGERRLENDVEHSWSVATLACVLAAQLEPDLDVGKIAQFGLVHDLVEVFAGDTKHFSAEESFKASKQEREKAALDKIRKDFDAFPWLSTTIAEYEDFANDEAAFVYAVDKFIAVIYDLLDKGRYLGQIGIDRARYDEIMEVHRIKAHRHAKVATYYDEIREYIDREPMFLKVQ